MCGKFWKQSRLGPFSYLTEGNFTKVIRYSFFFFSPSLKSSSPNRYKVKTHHFYLNQRSTSFLSVKALDPCDKAQIQIKRKTALIYYAVWSHYVRPRNESLSLSDFLSQDALIWLSLSAPGELFCLAYPINRRLSSLFSHSQSSRPFFLVINREMGSLLLKAALLPSSKVLSPFLKMQNIYFLPKTSGYLVWVTLSWGW